MKDPVRKFDFDTVFSKDGEVLRDGQNIKRILTVEEVEAAKQAAFNEGQNGEVAVAAQQQAAAIQAVASQMQLILARLQTESDMLRREAATLALVTARKIAGAALDQNAIGSVSGFVESLMSDLRGAPTFRVRCAEAIAGDVAQALEQTAIDTGFEGAIDVRADANMQGADCRLEWATGEIERNQADIEARVDALVEAWLAAPAEALPDAPEDDDPGAEAPATG